MPATLSAPSKLYPNSNRKSAFDSHPELTKVCV